MKSTDRTILLAIAMLGLVAAFWFLLLSPKREEASQLEADVAELQAQVDESEQAADAGEQAKGDFSVNYRRLVSLGKAVPKDADTSSLLVELQALSDRSDVDFRSISLDAASAGTAAAEVTATPPATATDATATAAATPAGTTTPGALPTEATAALLPIGATVGSAGLPVMPYALEFQGGFFDIADFFGRIDGMVVVDSSGDSVKVEGRLLTIDGFALEAGPAGFPSLVANVQASSYLTPADQGVTAGASPTAPAAAAPTDPAATATPAPATATVTP
ncbi:MAG: type II secretion system protein GspM [Solirubrobacterales bacterium]